MSSSVVFIGAPVEISILKAEPAFGDQVRMFTDADSLQAGLATTTEAPQVVVLGRSFAESVRDAALVNTIKTHESLANCQILVICRATDYAELVSRRAKMGLGPNTLIPGEALPSDYRGSRQFLRFRMKPDVRAHLDGKPATLVDLSRGGAKILTCNQLRPTRRSRLTDSRATEPVDGHALIVWALFEPQHQGEDQLSHCLKFADAEADAIEAFCLSHGTTRRYESPPGRPREFPLETLVRPGCP